MFRSALVLAAAAAFTRGLACGRVPPSFTAITAPHSFPADRLQFNRRNNFREVVIFKYYQIGCLEGYLSGSLLVENSNINSAWSMSNKFSLCLSS